MSEPPVYRILDARRFDQAAQVLGEESGPAAPPGRCSVGVRQGRIL
ncbi:MAG: hypothetical protein ACRDZ4_14100 [Egibacteraceae bacterium]